MYTDPKMDPVDQFAMMDDLVYALTDAIKGLTRGESLYVFMDHCERIKTDTDSLGVYLLGPMEIWSELSRLGVRTPPSDSECGEIAEQIVSSRWAMYVHMISVARDAVRIQRGEFQKEYDGQRQ